MLAGFEVHSCLQQLLPPFVDQVLSLRENDIGFSVKNFEIC